jgi:hypothetical protein
MAGMKKIANRRGNDYMLGMKWKLNQLLSSSTGGFNSWSFCRTNEDHGWHMTGYLTKEVVMTIVRLDKSYEGYASWQGHIHVSGVWIISMYRYESLNRLVELLLSEYTKVKKALQEAPPVY